jgi:Fur family ferric uptake transcriptional regulator
MAERMTVKRKLTLDIIESYDVPVSTRTIVEKLSEDMDQATVYRSIGWLELHGFIEGFTFTCEHEGTVRYYQLRGIDHRHYLHCSSCHSFQEIDRCIPADIGKLEEYNNVRIDHHVAYFSGICSRCIG